jgi:hypothetical protein
MAYLVEKKGIEGFMYHPDNKIAYWDLQSSELTETDARKKANDLAMYVKGTYRVRDIYSGKVLFTVTT